MLDKRHFLRYTKERRGHFRISSESTEWKECTVVDFSRNGMTIFFREKINTGSLCSFEIPIPEEETFIHVTGTVQWTEEKENGFTGGVALTEILDDDNFRKLLSGYTLIDEASSIEFSKGMQKHGEGSFSSPKNKQSSKKTFLALCFLIFLLSLPLLFMAVRGYSSGKPLNHDNNPTEVILKPTKLPFVIVKTTPVIPEQPALPEETVIQEEPVESVLKTREPHVARLKDNGGSFYSLARKHYQKANETIFDLIVQANPTITNVRRISDRKKITLPVITSESYLEKTDDGTYQVYIGTFETYVLATAYSKKVDKQGKLFSIKAHQFSPQDTWYRLTMGDYNNKRDALETAKLLKEAGLIYISPDVK
jgi:hypothetical protein